MKIKVGINWFDYVVYDGPSDKHGEWVQVTTEGGVQAAIVTVPSIPAYGESFKSVKRGGRVVGVALPVGNMSVPIVDWVSNEIELVGSVVGTRQDLQEALQLEKLHNIKCQVQKRKLEDINEIFDDMIKWKINGRVVRDFTKEQFRQKT
jgi:propanol-preferring alcohol dehydrogenase